jgi:hypothetical protein
MKIGVENKKKERKSCFVFSLPFFYDKNVAVDWRMRLYKKDRKKQKQTNQQKVEPWVFFIIWQNCVP